jgi:hypothetical protein
LGRGDGTFAAPCQFVTDRSTPSSTWGHGAYTYDDNHDGRMNLIVAMSTPSFSGSVVAPLNDGRPSSKFDTSVVVVADARMGGWGVSAVAAEDLTGDHVADLVVGSVSSPELRMYPGRLGGGFDPQFQSIPWIGGADVILSGDFSMDGRPDFGVGTDDWSFPENGHPGGNGWFYQNNGTPQPLSPGGTYPFTQHQEPHSAGRLFDFDGGTALDYDPESTVDFMMNGGNHSSALFMFANRPARSFVQCGTVGSGTLDMGALSTQSIIVTAAEPSPTAVVEPGTSITWETSNDGARRTYTAGPQMERLAFHPDSSANPASLETLLAADTDAANALVAWQRSARSGVAPKQFLGGIESSTAAIMGPPQEPYGSSYPTTTSEERSAIVAYKAAYANRPRLALVGARDGALHAFRTDPSCLSDGSNGSEAWAFIPRDVAGRRSQDMTSGDITAYPGGAPTLVNAKVNGQ